MPPTLEQKVELLWDKHAVTELMLQFGRALDRKDWDTYRSCLCERLHVDFERLTGFPPVTTSAALWTEFADKALSPWLTHHQYSNLSITINDDEATAVVYMVARHAHPENSAQWSTQYGWYRNVFVRCDDGLGWKIKELGHYFQWLGGKVDLIDMGGAEVAALIGQIFQSQGAES